MALALMRSARAGAASSLRIAAVASAHNSTPAVVRCFATQADATAASKGSAAPYILALAGAGAGFYFAKQQGYLDGVLGVAPAPSSGKGAPAKPDYGKVKDAIADMLDKEDYDDGSMGPVLVRLAWHASGTYDKNTNTGGSNGATMRFGEGGYAANAGLKVARDALEPIKERFPWISYADLWTLAGATAVEAMGGPEIKWRPGRSDFAEGATCPPDGRLPDGAGDAKHIRWVFDKMGFNDQEMVALSGAHALGRCHPDRSGWDGPWTNAPTTFSNEYYVQLFENKWSKKKWNGPLQYEDKSKTLMMLPTDMQIVWDKKFKKYAEQYYKDADKFAADFADAFAKLLELGVPFPDHVPGRDEVASPGDRPKGETGVKETTH